MKSSHVKENHRRRRAAMEPRSRAMRRRSDERTHKLGDPSAALRERDIVLAKQSPPPRRKPVNRRPNKPRPKSTPTTSKTTPVKKGGGLSEWLTPKNLQKSLKSVNSVRGLVKNCLNYLQQADQMLETFYVTSNSLRETGVLDKIIKNRGKNLTTDDFTGILAALMSSPIGGQLFKAMGGSGDKGTDNAAGEQKSLGTPE